MRLRQTTKDRALRETAGLRRPGKQYVLVNGIVETVLEEEPQMGFIDAEKDAITVTPELAQEWLKTSVINRVISPTRVMTYANDMRRGAWQANGSTICFSQKGELRDGHHRCLAGIEAGTSFRSLVVGSMPSSAVDTIDTGRGRSLNDVLRMDGVGSSKTTAAALRWVYRYRAGKMSWSSSNLGLSITQEREILAAEPGIAQCAAWADRNRRRLTGVKLSSSLAAAMYYLFSRLPGGEEDAEAFFDRLLSGAMLDPGSPVLLLRNWLPNNVKAEQYAKAAHIVVAWNHYRDDNNSLSKLVWYPSKSKFPAAR